MMACLRGLLCSLPLTLLFLVPFDLSAQSGKETWFKEYQLQGELVAPPLILDGLGVLAATDDRKLWLLDPENGKHITWTMQRRPVMVSASNNSLALVQLSDGRATLIHLQGRVIRIQDKLEDSRGTWLLNANGRLYFLSLKGRLTAFSPRGLLIGTKDLSRTFTRIDAIQKGLFEVETSEGVKGVVDFEGQFIPSTLSPIASLIKVEVRPGTYRIDLNHPDEHFVYDAKAALDYYSYVPRSGFLAWGDDRWKVFIKKNRALALSTPIESPVNSKSSVKAMMIRELEFMLADDRTRPEDLAAYFDYSLGNLENLDVLHLLLVDVLNDHALIKAPQAMKPSYREVLKKVAARLFTVQDSTWLARAALARPSIAWESLELAELLAMDTRGDLLRTIAAMAPRRLADADFVQAAKKVIRRSASSYPEDMLQVYFRLRAQLGDF